MSVDEDFADFVRARWSSLYRLAYLLAASPTGAEDLLQTTLEKAYVNWRASGRWSTPRRTCGGCSRTRWCRAGAGPGTASDRRTLPEAGDSARAAGPRPLAPLAVGVRAPGPAAGGDRAALLRGPERGADRRGPRLRAGHRQVPGVGRDRGAPPGRGRGGRGRGGGRVMNLGDQLRATLGEEADMQYATPTRRGPAHHRRARPAAGTATWRGLVAPLLALVLIGGGAYAVTQQAGGIVPGLEDRGLAERDVRPDRGPGCRGRHLPPDGYWRGGLDAGTYRVLVGSRRRWSPPRGGPDPGGGGWNAGNFPRPGGRRELRRGGRLPAHCARGCVRLRRRPGHQQPGGEPVLPRAAAGGAPGEHGRSNPPSPRELLGRYAVHVQVRIPQTCPDAPVLPRGGDTARRARHQLRQAGRDDGHRWSWTSG